MALNKINVDGIDYEVGGGKLYKHKIIMRIGQSGDVYIYEIINENEAQISQQQFINYINNYNWTPFKTTAILTTNYENGMYYIINAYYGNNNISFNKVLVYDAISYISTTSVEEVTNEMINDFTDDVTPFVEEV